jgi:hypothetical protein
LQVSAKALAPTSAHLVGDDVNECTLTASARWKAAGLEHIDLNAHGFGDEADPS